MEKQSKFLSRLSSVK